MAAPPSAPLARRVLPPAAQRPSFFAEGFTLVSPDRPQVTVDRVLEVAISNGELYGTYSQVGEIEALRGR